MTIFYAEAEVFETLQDAINGTYEHTQAIDELDCTIDQ